MIVGMVTVFGVAFVVILIALKRARIISFGNSSNPYCPKHDEFFKAFRVVSDEQISQREHIKQHEKKLEDGKEIFKEIRKDLGEIKINVHGIAILLKQVD